MKIHKKILCSLLSLFVSGGIIYADMVFSFPENITMYQSKLHNTALGVGVSIGNIPDDVCEVEESSIKPIKQGTYSAKLKVGNIPVRTVWLKVVPQEEIQASGKFIGIRIHNKGLIVTDLAPILSGGRTVSPAQTAGIIPGDIILEINGVAPTDSAGVASLLTENSHIVLKRNNSIKNVAVTPAKDDESGLLRLGLLVRDSSAGVGTLTYVNPQNLTFGALGHGISDGDTGIMFDVAKGTIEGSDVLSIEKGKRGAPGTVSGSFHGQEDLIGTITKNCEEGIFGDIFPAYALDFAQYPIGVMSQVRCGDAKILSAIDGSVREYDISILRSMPYGSATKGLFVEITDRELLEKTGGIVQGMSGSPIIQDGKLIGAITHVLINDPTRGYGIFIENMLNRNK